MYCDFWGMVIFSCFVSHLAREVKKLEITLMENTSHARWLTFLKISFDRFTTGLGAQGSIEIVVDRFIDRGDRTIGKAEIYDSRMEAAERHDVLPLFAYYRWVSCRKIIRRAIATGVVAVGEIRNGMDVHTDDILPSHKRVAGAVGNLRNRDWLLVNLRIKETVVANGRKRKSSGLRGTIMGTGGASDHNIADDSFVIRHHQFGA